MSTSSGAGATAGGSYAGSSPAAARPSRYESQKRRDWQTFTQYLATHRPPLVLHRCSGAHVLEFLRYLDRFGKTRVHAPPCPAYGGRAPAGPACQCPLRQAWGSLDALVGRLRAAYDERHGHHAADQPTVAVADAAGEAADAAAAPSGASANANPFAARAVRLYLRDVRDGQARARGISYQKKKKKKKKKNGGDDGMASTSAVGAGGLMPPLPPLPPCLNGVPTFECCEFGTVMGAAGAHGHVAHPGGGAFYGGFYLPLLFNTFT